MSTAPQPIVARHQPFVRTIWIGLWLLATLGFAALFYLGLVLGSLPLTVTGFIAAFASAWYLYRVWRDFRIDSDIVTVDAGGFHDRRLGPAIPWAEMKAISRHQPGTRVFLFIDADNPERFLGHRDRVQRAHDATRRRRGFPPLASDLSGFDIPGDDIYQATERFLAHAKGH